MLLDGETIDHLLDVAATAARSNDDDLAGALNRLPAAVYVTDKEGVITYYNQACVTLAGRAPELGRDKWCVTWKLYTTDGALLPHDECPMAVAIREKRPVRGVEAVAERPDGTRFKFEPYPTPLFDESGDLVGAVNLLVDVGDRRRSDYLRDQAERCRRLSLGVNDRSVVETLELMAAKYDEQALKAARTR
jgi:PAS domain S-box-containing protein